MKRILSFAAMLLICAAAALQAQTTDGINYYFWQGKLEGHQVKMSCAVSGDVLTGEMYETVDGEQRTYNVAGALIDGMFDIKVYAYVDDTEFGIEHIFFLRAKIQGGKLKGIVQTSGKKFTLKTFDDPYALPLNREAGVYSSPYVEGKTFALHGWDGGGSYYYENARHVEGEMTLFFDPDRESFNLNIRRDAEARGAGSDALVSVGGIKPNQVGDFDAIIRSCGYSFTVSSHDHFIVIRTLAGKASQCFGGGSGIVGIYIQVPAKG